MAARWSAERPLDWVRVPKPSSSWRSKSKRSAVRRPPLPRAMLAGTAIVLVLYVALNAVFLHTAPIDKLSGQLDVARIAGTHIFGDIGGRIVGAMICIGLVSSISAITSACDNRLRSPSNNS